MRAEFITRSRGTLLQWAALVVPKIRPILEHAFAEKLAFSSAGASQIVPIFTIFGLKNRVRW
jgi:hypothetical protein